MTEKLEPLTKDVFNLWLKEWRISYLSVDGNDSSFSVYRIVANDAREALAIFLHYISLVENEEDLEDNFISCGVNSLEDLEDDEGNIYYANPRWEGKSCEDTEVSISEIDPFTGDLEIKETYKTKFEWNQ